METGEPRPDLGIVAPEMVLVTTVHPVDEGLEEGSILHPADCVMQSLLPLNRCVSSLTHTQLERETIPQPAARCGSSSRETSYSGNNLAKRRIGCRQTRTHEGTPTQHALGYGCRFLQSGPSGAISKATCSVAVACLPISLFLYGNKL